jgi:HEAT repeat protein
MARARTLEAALVALKQADAADEVGCRLQLAESLLRDPARAAAKAAEIARARSLEPLVPDLLRAFDRFMARPQKSDPGCVAKTAIVEALARLGHDDPSVFLRGIRHVQKEPVYGGQVDTAVDLRGASAFGLVALGHPAVLYELADLLADAEAPARISAAQALAALGSDEAVPLLRLRALIGDAEPRVLTECLLAILKLQPASGLAFVLRQLDSEDEARALAAAVALGESRLPEACGPLVDWVGRSAGGERRRTGLLALGLLRREEAFDHLLGVLGEARAPTSLDALQALAPARGDERLRARVQAVVEERRDPKLASEFRRVFGAQP